MGFCNELIRNWKLAKNIATDCEFFNIRHPFDRYKKLLAKINIPRKWHYDSLRKSQRQPLTIKGL